MTEVKFYILSQAGGRERFVCRLAEQRCQQGDRLYLHTGSAAQAARLDQLLWTFRDGSFVPHARVETLDPAAPPPPVLIGHDAGPQAEPAADPDRLLINLADAVPLFFSRYPTLVEVIDQTPELLAGGRERYRFYRDRGYPITDHRL